MSIVEVTIPNVPHMTHCLQGYKQLPLSSSTLFLLMLDKVEGYKLTLFWDMKLEQYSYKDNYM